MNPENLDDLSDAELLNLCRNPSEVGAYERLAARHYPRCLRRANAILDDPADAEDAVQDALVRAFLKLDQIDQPDRFPGWLDRVVLSCCVSLLRGKHPERFAPLPDGLEDDAVDPEQALLEKQREEAVSEAIDALPARYRDPVRLFHVYGQSYKHIAEVLNLPLGTVQSLISRARDRLEVLLKPYSRTAHFCL